MSYTVKVLPRAAKELAAIDKPQRRRIQTALLQLSDTPRPQGVKALVGEPGILRLRVGDYRVFYQVKDSELLVLVIRIGHRREIYNR